jgi:hypothetical protein
MNAPDRYVDAFSSVGFTQEAVAGAGSKLEGGLRAVKNEQSSARSFRVGRRIARLDAPAAFSNMRQLCERQYRRHACRALAVRSFCCIQEVEQCRGATACMKDRNRR